MDKDFDTTLSAALHFAADAAPAADAQAARIRGRQRAMRKRIIVSTTSFVLLAAGVTGAFAATASHGGTPQTTAASPHATGSPSGSPASSPADTPSTPTTGPSTATSPSSPTTSGTSSTGATNGIERWLSPAQVPFDSAMNWTAAAPSHCAGSMVFMSIYPGDCTAHDMPGAAHTALKMDTVVFNSAGVPTGNGAWAPPAADQAFYTFASAGDARSAFQSITHDILGEDAQFDQARDGITGRPVRSTTTATAHTADSLAIDHTLRDDNGTPAVVNGNASASSDTHYFFAVKGEILEVLEIRSGPSISDTSNDAAILHTVISALG